MASSRLFCTLFLLLGTFLVVSSGARLPGKVKGSPMALTCTSWSWALCRAMAKNTYKVMVNKGGGGGMQAPVHYLNGVFSLDMKLPAGNSGGVNFAWYLMDTISPTNKDPKHSEIDVEFYGNTTGKGALLALNVFAQGKQNLAQFRLPFDPSAAYHTYSIKWGPNEIVWLVDRVPIRILRRTAGEPWPNRAMKPMATVWATPWTKVKADFRNGPIFAYYANYTAAGCLAKDMDILKPAGVQCNGAWNSALTPAQLAAYKKFNAQTQVVDYGWDKA